MALAMSQPNDSNTRCQRIQYLEREIQEEDKTLKQEREGEVQQQIDNMLERVQEIESHIQKRQRHTQEQDNKMQHVLARTQKVRKIEPRHLKRRQRDLLRGLQAKKRQRALQQERDLALQEAEKKERELQLAEKRERRAIERARAFKQERDRALQQAKERTRALQQERDRALKQAEERAMALQQERTRAMLMVLEGDRQAQETIKLLKQERDRVIKQVEKTDQEADERDQRAQERARGLQEERDTAIQQAQERARALRQERETELRLAWDKEKALQEERDRALQRLQEIDPLLQPSTLGDFIKECHASLFSKLTVEPNAGRGSDATTTNLRGKWRPEKVMQWTDFLSEQRLIFDKVCEVFPSELRVFPRPTTVRQNGTKIVPIADEKTLERFIDVSIAEPVRNIITQLQSVDKLGRVCPGDIGIDFVIRADHAKPLEIDTTPSRPKEPEPVRTRYCIYRAGSTSMASATWLYVWEPKVPGDLTIQDLRAVLQPTARFGELAAGTEGLAVEDIDEISQSVVTAEKQVRDAISQTYRNMMESCLEFGILTTGQANVFLHVNWDDPQTLYYHIAEPALDVAQAPEGDAAFLSAVSQYVAFTIMALTKRRKPLQERRMEVFKTLTKSGKPSRLPVAEHVNAELRNSGPRKGECDTQSTKTHQNGGRDQDSAPDLPYCTQKCLLGLVQGEYLDPKCPNVTLHCQGEAGEAGRPQRHPVDHAEWLRLLREQFKKSIDVGITYQVVIGARGALFKVTLLAYGYTFVSKGTVAGHIQHLEHEARVYERLKPIQGRYVPVFLGTIDLRTMDKDYWIYFETYVVHMMFFSWGGILFHVLKAGMDQLETLHDVSWVDEGVRALEAVHKEGVLHCDVRWGNVLFNSETKGIMVIDFERAELLDGHATRSSEKDTRKEDGLRKTDKQLRIEACNEERAEEEEREMFGVIEDALGIDSDDSSELEDSDF
ncbi:hypothetical protein E4U13_004042 [Claviceps humidiphila]|uniref:Protein kinase domain-containing protein n=1 Tax=Claviceps humidiphila TaxID=1294629 RepID=A0A9P7PZ51_9HYPO|nr:hypothetical protein E4U13_004042 [Claviceps humidiphila]